MSAPEFIHDDWCLSHDGGECDCPFKPLTALQAENARLQAKVDKLAGELRQAAWAAYATIAPDTCEEEVRNSILWLIPEEHRTADDRAALDKDAENG